MYKLTRLISLADRARLAPLAEELRALGAAHSASRSLVVPTLEGSHFGGDLLARFAFETVEARDALAVELAPLLSDAAIASVDGADYRGSPGARPEPDLANGVYRVLLLSVDEGTAPDRIAAFEAETRMMPHYIPAIRNWQLSRADAAIGERRWTHVWEQEYRGPEGLLGPYMLHPYHWARIDRWFDSECPDRIVDARLCHSFCAFEGRVI